MKIREKLDISAYFVVGPENTKGRPVAKIVKDAVEAGFTCIQIRSKTASARELIKLTLQSSNVIASAHKSDEVALLVDDRLDVVLAARKQGIKVDGIHVGQLAGLPRPVVSRAYEILQQLEQTSGEAVRINPEIPKQIALFPETNPLLKELEGIDVNDLSPIEALNKLYEWQRRFLKQNE